MKSQEVEHQIFQEQDNALENIAIHGSGNTFTFAPTQNTIVKTQIIQIAAQKVTQHELNKESPYKGLKRFNISDRHRFFGRDALIKKLLEAVNRSQLILVTGASGSGKSSVVRAGLIPELKQTLETQKFHDFIFTPGRDPFESLYRCLLSEEKDYHFSESSAKISLERNPSTLSKVIRKLKQGDERWLWFIDQFEELFTNCDDDKIRQHFINGLFDIATSKDTKVRVVLGMRADFLEQFSFYPSLGNLVDQNNIHLVTEMYPDELRQAIEQPAAQNGVVFEQGVVEQIITDIQGQKGYLPLLQYTLNLLWETECQTRGIEDRTLNLSTYNALEGVRGALQARVNKIYQNLKQQEKTATKQIFLRLVNIVETEGGSRPVSRRANMSEFIGEWVEPTLKTFVDENLLVSSIEYEREKTSGKNQKATIEIAHEILLSSWDELKRWLEEEKETIILKNYLADEARRWQRVKGSQGEYQARDELLKGARLEQIVVLRDAKALEKMGGLSPDENEFVDASVTWRNEQEKQQKKRRRNTILSLSIFSVVALALSIWGLSSSTAAKNNLQLAQRNSTEAEKNAAEAEKNAIEAEKNAIESEENAARAERNAIEAKENAARAEKNAAEAEKNAIEAE
nr:ATP-binding protein [Leptolyngbyaceae cyanobacterium MO_188.B28]